MKPVYADLHDLPEDEHVAIIGAQVQAGKCVAFFTDNDAKADRYIRKLAERFGTEVEARGEGPIPNVVYVKVRPKLQ